MPAAVLIESAIKVVWAPSHMIQPTDEGCRERKPLEPFELLDSISSSPIDWAVITDSSFEKYCHIRLTAEKLDAKDSRPRPLSSVNNIATVDTTACRHSSASASMLSLMGVFHSHKELSSLAP